MPQHAFLSGENGEIIVDRLLRFETIAEDFEALCQELGFGALRIGHENRSGENGSRLTIPDRDIDFLRDYYAKDYALLASPIGRRKRICSPRPDGTTAGSEAAGSVPDRIVSGTRGRRATS